MAAWWILKEPLAAGELVSLVLLTAVVLAHQTAPLRPALAAALPRTDPEDARSSPRNRSRLGAVIRPPVW